MWVQFVSVCLQIKSRSLPWKKIGLKLLKLNTVTVNVGYQRVFTKHKHCVLRLQGHQSTYMHCVYCLCSIYLSTSLFCCTVTATWKTASSELSNDHPVLQLHIYTGMIHASLYHMKHYLPRMQFSAMENAMDVQQEIFLNIISGPPTRWFFTHKMQSQTQTWFDVNVLMPKSCCWMLINWSGFWRACHAAVSLQSRRISPSTCGRTCTIVTNWCICY